MSTFTIFCAPFDRITTLRVIDHVFVVCHPMLECVLSLFAMFMKLTVTKLTNSAINDTYPAQNRFRATHLVQKMDLAMDVDIFLLER